VEHTVTEMVTGIDIVQAQIQIAQGLELHGAEMICRARQKLRCRYALQCRVTTEDREWIPPGLRKDSNLPFAGRFGSTGWRVAYRRAVITPYYDSLAVKVTAWARFRKLAPDGPLPARVPHPRSKNKHPVLTNVVNTKNFTAGGVTTSFLAETPELFQFAPLKDRATKLLVTSAK